MDVNYSHFVLQPEVDWKKLRETYRPAAIDAKDAAELTGVLKNMLAPLRDPHVWIETPTEIVGSFPSGYRFNGNRQATLAQLEDVVRCGKFALVGKTKRDGFGYFLMLQQAEANKEDVEAAVKAIHALHDAPAFVVDLRTANGGSENLAADVASQFCEKDAVYATSKYRNGPEHDAFGEVYERVLPASPGAFTRPVLCLIGPGAISSGEGFVQMLKCLPQMFTVGLNTRVPAATPELAPSVARG